MTKSQLKESTQNVGILVITMVASFIILQVIIAIMGVIS